VRPSRTCFIATCAVLLVAAGVPGISAVAAPQNEPIELRNPYFDWVDVIEEGASYEWSVDVTNNTSNPVRLQIILDLLDDDGRPVNRDDQNNPFDAVIITVQPGTTVPVEQQGVLSYDRAAEVISYQHRHRVIQ